MKVIIADDHALVREGMAQVLTLCETVTEVMEASSHVELLDVIEANPDTKLVLLDINMVQITTGKMISELKARYPSIGIAVISVLEDANLARDLLASGAVGYVPKSTTNEILTNAVRLMLSGGVYIPSFVLAGDALSKNNGSNQRTEISLTPRQLDVLELIAKGYSNNKIADTLNLSLSTVKAHASAIINALGVNNRLQAVNEAIKLGWIKG